MFSRRTRKAIAAFFLVLIVQSVIVPTLSYALTAGPTAPEFSSFEPVDTTDMVNLATGEFVYNTPVLEVPGPEGGYPLSLSYHAGIKLDQEASWVGLGWTLNPGAINRSVNGFADDNVSSKREVRDYWGGGSQVTKTYSLGVTIPSTGVGISYSLARTRDTYKGFSSSSIIGASYGSYDVSMKVKSSATSKNNVSFNSAGVSVGVDGGKFLPSSSLGISISSSGIKSNATLVGINLSEKNNSAGKISSIMNEVDRGTAPIGNFGFFSMKDFYTRYWSDEAQSIFTYGSLYPGLGNEKVGGDHYVDHDFMSYAFDSYDVFDENPIPPSSVPNIVDDINDPAKQLGGSLPAFDRYDVLGQGIGGVIQPHIFENGDLYGQSFYERNPVGQPALTHPIIGYKSMKKFTNKKVDFRFLNDFSNSLTVTTPEFQETSSPEGVGYSVVGYSANSPQEGFNYADENQKLVGSKHIEWFTNNEIASGVAQAKGFIDCYVEKSQRKLDFDIYEDYLQPEACLPYTGNFTYGKGHGSFKKDTYAETDPYEDVQNPQFHSLKSKKSDLKNKIGGFMITNETGVTYHYAQPVYNYNEYTRLKLKKPRKGVSTFREIKNNEPYAYTWLLTAITGPDYVDSNDNNVLDDGDWGYWVKFDYGRWADAYQWRTPHSGYADDIENEYATFSYGIKELYYLDAIETRTHKAIFIKSKRKDGRGVTSRLEGGSNPRRFEMHYKNFGQAGASTGDLNFVVNPVSTMKLDAIYLFKKSELAGIGINKDNGTKYEEATTLNPYSYLYEGAQYQYTIPNSNPAQIITIKPQEDKVQVKYHNGNLVYDDDDIYKLDQFRKKALRIIEFNTDYSLAEGVSNSIGFLSDLNRSCIAYGPSSCDDTGVKIGDNYEWPQSFGQSICTPLPGGSPSCCLFNEQFYSQEGIFALYNNSCAGNESKYSGNAIQYYKTGKLTLTSIKFLGKGGADLIPPTLFAYGENPDYNKDKYDYWGYYKSDYPDHGPLLPSEGGPAQYGPIDPNTTREIATSSAAKVNAWSLKSVTSPLGAVTEIEYEASQYQKSVYNDFSVLSVENLELVSGGNVKVFFKEKGMNLNKWFSVGGPVDIKSFVVKEVTTVQGGSTDKGFSKDIYQGNANNVVNEIGQDFIRIGSPDLFLSIMPIVNQPLLDANGQQIGSWSSTSRFVSGFVKVADPAPETAYLKYSGGIRVHAVALVDEHLGRRSVVYSYKDPSNEFSSGVTSFKPFNQPSALYPVDVAFFDDILQGDNKEKRKKLESYQIEFQKLINEQFKSVLTYSREAPAPGALYGCVTVTSFLNDLEDENYTTHRFRVFNENMIEKEVINTSDEGTDKKTIVIKNNTIDVGNIVSIESFKTGGEPLSTLEYNYLFDGNNEPFENQTMTSKQGLVEQSFHKSLILREYKIDLNWNSMGETIFGGGEPPETHVLYKRDKALITKRQDRSTVVTSIRETDHKKGLVTETQHHVFDFYSGQPLKTLTADSYGNKYLSETVPAYHNYPAMGLKIYDITNKHMLTQSSEQYSFLLGTDNKPSGLLSSSVQTWSKDIPVFNSDGVNRNIWRKESAYQWNGQQELVNGAYPYGDFNTHRFNWTIGAVNDHWEKVAEITMHDNFSHELEGKDINGNFAATLMNRNQERVIASASNASYKEIANSGAEYYSANTEKEGSVDRGQGEPATAFAHTGKFSLMVGKGSNGFNYTLSSTGADLTKKYRASVWVYAPGYAETQSELDKIELYYKVNGGAETKVHPTHQKNKSKSWYLISIDINPAGGNEVYIGVRNNAVREVYFDDFRVHPLNASFTSYVYDDATGELTHILDGNNFYTKFEYDAMGRLLRTKKELLNFDYGDGKESFRADAVLKEVNYNYGKN